MKKLRWDLDLLTVDNAKTIKGESLGYRTMILYLSPADMGGKNLCPNASEGCKTACLNTAGRGAFDSVQAGRAMRTAKFHADRARFIARLDFEIARGIRSARRAGLKVSVRLNGTSDINWYGIAPELFEKYADAVTFYDYTKNAPLAARAPYHLTFSRAEHNHASARAVIASGGNVAVAFAVKRGAPLPSHYLGAPVIDGDLHDLRFLDPRGVVVGLRAKGKARADVSGFVVAIA